MLNLVTLETVVGWGITECPYRELKNSLMNTTRNSLDLSSKGLNQHPTWLVRIIPVEIGMFRATIFPVISDMTGKNDNTTTILQTINRKKFVPSDWFEFSSLRRNIWLEFGLKTRKWLATLTPISILGNGTGLPAFTEIWWAFTNLLKMLLWKATSEILDDSSSNIERVCQAQSSWIRNLPGNGCRTRQVFFCLERAWKMHR